MGWLRDLMAATEPKLRSYGELARQCLEHADWPRDIQPQARSLASLFSKFDRGIEVEWLDDRPEVQVVLADVLRVPPHTLETELRKHTQRESVQPFRYRLPDAPSARPLDLREDALPPGLPERLLRPGLWEREWWQIGRTAGTELVGQWLRARGLADHVTCTTPEELEPLSAQGRSPLFVELTFPVSARQKQSWVFGRPVCIAAPGAGPDQFNLLHSPPAESLVEEWLDWLAPLLPREGHFHKQRVLSWLTMLWSHNLPCSFETVVGLTAFADEHGELALSCTSPEALATEYLAQALQRARDAGTTEADWMQSHCLDVLCGMARRAALDADTTWDASRSHARWLELVPPEYHRGVDAEWTRISLQQAGSPLTVTDLEKALKAMPPGAFRVVSVLTAARLLREDNQGLRFGPAWLSALLKDWGRASLLDGAAFEWGELALHPHQFDWLFDALNARLEAGDQNIIDAALELDDDDSPSFVLAIEMLVTAAGRSVLLAQDVDQELVLGLLELQSTFALDDGIDGFAPRLLTSIDNPSLYGQWLLATWALSEQLDPANADRAMGVNPWLEQTCSLRHLNAVEAALAAQPKNSRYVSGAYELLGRLLQHYSREQFSAPASGVVTAATSEALTLLEHPLFGVARVLRDGGWTAWELAQAAPHGVEGVHSLVPSEAWPHIAKAAWRSWVAAGLPNTGNTLFDGNGPYAFMFWPHLPDHILRELLHARAAIVLTVPGAAMKDEWITMYLERVPQESMQAVPYLNVIPIERVTTEHVEVLFELLEAHALTTRIQDVWNAHPEPALAHVRRYLDHGKPSQVQLWLEHVPEAQLDELVAYIKTQVTAQGASYPSLNACRAWLHRLCITRVPGWPACYELLSEMEQRLKRAARARIAP